MKFIGTDVERNVFTELKQYLPSYYSSSNVANEILRVDALELEDLFFNIKDVLDQFTIDHATWGLDIWEKELSISHTKGKTIQQRREIIRSKARGYGVSTVALIKQVAESYAYGKIGITEFKTNMLPPFSEWTLGSGITVKVMDDYQITYDTTSVGVVSQVTIKTIPNQTYTLSFNEQVQNIETSVKDTLSNTVLSPYNLLKEKVFVAKGDSITVSFRQTGTLKNPYAFIEPMLNVGDKKLPFEAKKDFTVGISFIDDRGTPSNLADIEKSIADIIPAHLIVEYIFTYLRWSELNALNKTWAQMANENLTWAQFEKYRGGV